MINALGWSKNDDGHQWYGNATDSLGVTHYGFARLKQTTTSITARINYTLSPTIDSIGRLKASGERRDFQYKDLWGVKP